MSAIVRLDALEALAKLIERAIPEVAGAVCAGTPPSGHYEHVPNVTIEPSKWIYAPEQQDEHAVLPGNVVVWNVGEHSSGTVLSVVAASPRQRASIEARILDLFLSSKHPLTGMPRPGILVVPVVACPILRKWIASFELESDEWIDTGALDRRYESRIVVNAIVPALTVERAVFTIEQLQLALGADASTAAIASPIAVVQINQDGSISPIA